MIPTIATAILVGCVLFSWANLRSEDVGPFPLPDVIRGCVWPVLLLMAYMLFWIIYLAVT